MLEREIDAIASRVTKGGTQKGLEVKLTFFSSSLLGETSLFSFFWVFLCEDGMVQSFQFHGSVDLK